jgi:DNA-binding protein YbaB
MIKTKFLPITLALFTRLLLLCDASFVVSSNSRKSYRENLSHQQRFAFPWFGGGTEDSDESDEMTSANLGNVASVMESMNSYSKSQSIAKRTQGVLQDLSNSLIDGSSADGKVKVTYNGQQKPVGVQIDPGYFFSLKNDKEGAEELSAAVQQAIEEAHEKTSAKMEEKMNSLYRQIGFED